MFEYMTAQETADKWNVSLRWVQRLCKENRIEGVMNVNRVWLIPKDAKKPVDARLKTVCLQKEGKICQKKCLSPAKTVLNEVNYTFIFSVYMV